ncbi:alpha/beta hydrolase [Myceligenerans indicum]|uniref:DUF1023 domain-containing protein n=1 Tax=Myceligenerans indicum TaxID=2593663 RepID=A0ABS1LH55_9MICO|nr:alpha/beta hydrolase [Myceligenerans indicum]MBL0885565.1 hypothetical protein [Myceligenerans indicum]
MSGGFTGTDGLIDASAFPIASGDLDLDWLVDQAAHLRRIGAATGEAARRVAVLWGGVADHYSAPEAPRMYRAMDPVEARGEHEQQVHLAGARHIDHLAHELRPLKQKLQRIEFEADTFRNQVVSGVWVGADDVARGLVLLEPAELAGWYDGARTGAWVTWAKHRPSIERNEELIADGAHVTGQIRAAAEDLERRLRELTPGDAGQGMVGRGSRHGGSLAASGTDPADISWFVPDQEWVDGATPAEIRGWWDGLDPWQRRALIAGIPLLVGNLNGIPMGSRAEANEINLRNEIARLEGELARLDDVPSPAVGESLGGWLGRVFAMKRQRDDLRAAIDSYATYLDLPEPRDRYGYDADGEYAKIGTTTRAQVIAFDPAKDAIATYNGPLDEHGDIPGWVKNIAIHVPGTTTKVESYDGTDLRGYQMYDAANRAKLGAEPTAIITWAGGRLPQHVDAAWDGYSRDLGPKLADFAAGVRRSEDSTLTVTGHSYGAAVVGHAEAAGLEADRILYVAGAGLGNDDEAVADFPRTGDKPHYSMIARNDLVTGSSQNADLGHLGHGASPQDDPDVVRLETGFQEAGDEDSGTIEDLNPIGAHSGVYTVGSTSFANIVGVITGTQVELYAPDRVIGTTYDSQPIVVDGTLDPGYEPNTVDVTELEERQATP